MDGQFVHLCIIDISKKHAWIQRIPIAIVFRVSDLQTFKLACVNVGSSRGDRKRTRTGTVERLSSVLSSLTSILYKIISDPRYNYYYGLRDYYGLVKFSQAELSSDAANGFQRLGHRKHHRSRSENWCVGLWPEISRRCLQTQNKHTSIASSETSLMPSKGL